VDVYNFVIGSVLSQKDDKLFDHLIYFASKQLEVVKINYRNVKRSVLGMIYFVQKFKHYLLGYPFVFHVDHEIINQ
jgi:hypothetical protein